MKSFCAIAIVLLVVLSSTDALTCTSLLPAKICTKIDAVGDAMTDAVAKANTALVEAVKEAAQRAMDIYKAGLTLIKDELKAKAALLATKLKDLQDILDNKLEAVSQAQRRVIDRAVKAIEEAQLKVAKAIEKAVASAGGRNDTQATKAVAGAFSLADDDVTTSLTTATKELGKIISTAIQNAKEAVKTMKSFIEELLKKIGASSSDVQFFNDQADTYLINMGLGLSAKAQMSAQASVASSVVKAKDMMDDIQAMLPVRRRSITDIWGKVTSSLQVLGQQISKKAHEIIQKKKPEIIQALKNVGKILIETGKQIVLELAKDIVTAVISKTGDQVV